MTSKACGLLILILSLIVPLAYAQTAAQPNSQQPSQQTVGQQPKRQSINFEDQLVKGELKRPELFQILQRRQFNFGRLIKLRENFNPEIRRTGEEIQRGGD